VNGNAVNTNTGNTDEERLTRVLDRAAARLRPDTLRALTIPEDTARTGRGRHWRSWAAPLAAAVSVVLLVSVAVAVTGSMGGRATGSGKHPASAPVTAADIPEYLAAATMTDQPNKLDTSIVVLSTSTGAEVARTPIVTNGRATTAAVAGAPDDRTFYVAEVLGSQTRIYSFSIPRRGKLAPMTPVKGGVVDAIDVQNEVMPVLGQLVVSPDGTKLALTVTTTGPDQRTVLDKIVVIDLRTGAQDTWQGGLDRPGKTFSITDLSWAQGRNSLVFLAQWCDVLPQHDTNPFGYCSGTNAPLGYRDAQVRSVSMSSGGGSLAGGSLLLRQSARYPTIVQAIGDPDGTDITAMVLPARAKVSSAHRTVSWRGVAVDQISPADGSLLAVDYRLPGLEAQAWVGVPFLGSLTTDPSGRYLVLGDMDITGYPAFPTYGWIGQGKLHKLPYPSPPSAKTGFWGDGPVAW
jgi:hypothetical protein